MSGSWPLFEVTTPAADAAARRLTTAVKVQAALRIGATDTALIESYIDTVSAECVRFAGLARAAAGGVPTFGQEVVRATWLSVCYDRGSILRLPWRMPVSAIGAVVEDGVNLAVNVDFRLLGAAMLERIREDSSICWSRRKIVVPYTAGWALPDGVPAEIEGQVIEQVKLKYLATDRDPAVRVEDVPDVYSVTYSSTGGLASTSISERGLLYSLEAALAPFKNPSV